MNPNPTSSPQPVADPNLGGTLGTTSGEAELANLEVQLNLEKDSTPDPDGRVSVIREHCRALGRIIVENSYACEERKTAIANVGLVFRDARTAAYSVK